MASRWLAGLLCLVTLMAILLSVGCANAFTEERVRRRKFAMETDLDHLIDDVDWALGIEEPSILYEDSFPPHP
ncbi:MAG: hypothetical protein ACYS8K_03775 [Planctomycetota bacterium]|jgi:hypothetical protein